MKWNFFWVLFLVFNIAHASVCSLDITEKVIISHHQNTTSSILKNCSDSVSQKIMEHFFSFEGKVSRKYLETIINHDLENKVKINSKANEIEIIHLKTFISNQLKYNHSNYSSSTLPQIISLASGDTFNLTQINDSEFKLIINHENQSEDTYQMTISSEKMITAYELKNNINAFHEKMSPEFFTPTLVPITQSSPFIQDINNISYFKTNKPLKKGDVLRKTDLSPITIVKAGDRTELLFQGEELSIKIHGISRQHGGLNDEIEVMNLSNNKKYSGKIIDHKKVLIKL